MEFGELPGWWTHGRAEKVTCLGRGWKIYTPSPYSMPCTSLPLDFLNCIFYHKLMTTGKLLSCVLWVMPVNYGDRGRDCGKFWICRQSGRSVGCLGPSLWLLSEMGTVSRDWVLTLWGLCKLRVVSVIKIELNCQAIGWYHKAGNWLLILEKEITDPRSINRRRQANCCISLQSKTTQQ